MLKILHKGAQISLDLDQTTLNGDIDHDVATAYIQGLLAGRACGINSSGKAALASSKIPGTLRPLGLIINNAAGYTYENKPALASKKIGITCGPCMVVSDQIVTGRTFSPGELIYVADGASAGLLTNLCPTPAVGASGTLLGVTMNAVVGAFGNFTVTFVNGEETGIAVVSYANKVVTVSIKSGTTTQTTIHDALEARTDLFASVTVASGGSAVTLPGGSGDTVVLAGGSDAVAPFGQAMTSASLASPELTLVTF